MTDDIERARPNAALAYEAANVDAYEALRLLLLRFMRLDACQSIKLSIVQPAELGTAWRVKCAVVERYSHPNVKAVVISTDENRYEGIELEIKSDVGALELSGHSLAIPRSPHWKSVLAFSSRPFRDEVYRDGARVGADYEGHGSTFWHFAEAPTVDRAVFELRIRFARALEERIKRNLQTLRDAGREFDLGLGWDPFPQPKSQTVDTTGETIDVEDFETKFKRMAGFAPIRLPKGRN